MNYWWKIKIQALKDKNEQLEIENRRLSAFTLDLTSQLADQLKKPCLSRQQVVIKCDEERIKTLEETLHLSFKEIDELREKNRKLELVETKLTHHLDCERQSNRSLGIENDNLKRSNNEWQLNSQDLNKENEKLTKEIECLNKQYKTACWIPDTPLEIVIEKKEKLQEENHRLEGGVNLLRQKIDDLERELDDVRPYKEWYYRRCKENRKLRREVIEKLDETAWKDGDEMQYQVRKVLGIGGFE